MRLHFEFGSQIQSTQSSTVVTQKFNLLSLVFFTFRGERSLPRVTSEIHKKGWMTHTTGPTVPVATSTSVITSKVDSGGIL